MKENERNKHQDNTSFYTGSEWEHFIHVNGIYASDNHTIINATYYEKMSDIMDGIFQ